MIQLTLTLKLTTAQVVETSVTVNNNNSPIQDYVQPDDHTHTTFEMTPVFNPFTVSLLPCGPKFLRDFIFCGLTIFCVLRELIFAILRKYPGLKIFSFLSSTCNRNTYFQTINQYFVVCRFVSE